MSLKLKTARNSLLMSGVLFAVRAINLVVAVILARLLEPSDFGLVALVMLLMQASNLFTSLGMGQALIHSQHDRSQTAFPSFVIVMGAGLFFFGLIQISSDWLTLLLGDGTTSPVLRALSYLILLNALSLIPLSLLRKELQFGPIGMAQIVSQLVYGVVAIAFAYWGYGFWSIVYANLLNTLTSTILYWVKCPGSDWWRPKLWDWNIVHSLFRYGMKTTANGMISYLHMHIDDWFVGRVLGSQPLGFYSQAYGFSNSTIANLGKNVIANVFFPSYAKIQNDKERLSRAYLKSVNLVLLIMTPMALGLLVASPEIVSVILGNKWLPMIPTLQVFGLLILTGPVSENAAPLFQAVGLPGYNVRAGIVLISVMAPLMFLLLSWGISGIATAVVVAHTVAVSYNIYQMNTILPGTARKTFVIALPILLAGLLMLGGVYWVKPYVLHLTSGQENLWSLLTMIGVGGIIYGSVSLFTQRALMREVSNIVLSALLLKRRAQQAA